jgi:hypothetical protein
MANEVTVSGSLVFTANGQNLSLVAGGVAYSPTEVEAAAGIATVGTSDETLALGDISAPGWVIIKNLDATNFVLLGSDGTSYPIKILPGQTVGPVFWNAAAVHVKADTADCAVAYQFTGR